MDAVPDRSVTVALPSIFPDKLKVCLDNVLKYTESASIYIDMQPGGVANALQRLFESCNTKYFCYIGDDTIVTEGWLDKALTFYEKNYNGKPLLVGFKCKDTPVPKIEGFPYPFIGLLLTETMKQLGGFNRGFTHYYIDPDIALRVWKAGGTVLFCPDLEVIQGPFNEEKRKLYLGQDSITFHNLWRKK